AAGGDRRRHPVAEDQPFEQRVGGQAVGAVDAGAGHLAAGPQAGQGGGAVDVGHHAPAEVVGGRRYRQPLPGRVETGVAAVGPDRGEAPGEVVDRRGVEPQVVEAPVDETPGDGPGDDVPGGEI